MKYEIQRDMPILEKLLLETKLNIFVGSGISINSRIPTWNHMINEYLDMVKNIRFVNQTNKSKIQQIHNDAKTRQANGIFYPIVIAKVPKNTFKEVQEISISRSQAYIDYRNWRGNKFSTKVPNQKHRDIVAMDYKYILTLNYNDLLQVAEYNDG